MACRPAGWSSEEDDSEEEMRMTKKCQVPIDVPEAPVIGRGHGRLIGRKEEEDQRWTGEIQVQEPTQRWPKYPGGLDPKEEDNGGFEGIRKGRGKGGRRNEEANGQGKIKEEDDKVKMKRELLKRILGWGEADWEKAGGRLKEVWIRDQQQKGAPNTDSKRYPETLHGIFRNWHQDRKGNLPGLALYLGLYCMEIAFHPGKCQSQAVFEGFAEYLKSLPNSTGISFTDSTSSLFISQALQQAAFQVALFSRKDSLQKLIFSIYLSNVTTSSNPQLVSYILEEINKLCSKHDYSIAAQCAISLNLRSQVDIRSFIVPLLLQDKLPLVEEFLSGSPAHQRELLQFLDSFFNEERCGSTVYAQLFNYCSTNSIPHVKCEKLQHKPLAKLIKRLRTKYNLGFEEACPNIGHRQRFGELRHLFSRRYEKEEMNADSFAELIEDLSQNDKSLWTSIVHHYLMYQDFQGCAKFITQKEMWEDQACDDPEVLKYLPEDVRKVKEQERVQQDENWEDEDWGDSPQVPQKQQSPPPPPPPPLQEKNWEVEFVEEPQNVEKRPKIKEYYRHPFPDDQVILYQTPEQVLELCQSLVNVKEGPLKLSGFDSEWKPILSKSSGAALLQLAFQDKIHLVDVVTLKKNLESEANSSSNVWQALRQSYFENLSILKLGFDLKSDLKMLMDTVPQWKGLSQTWRSTLDLSTLKGLIVKECPNLFHQEDALPNTEGESGLSELLYLCTGQSLSKDEQMSDWEKRPLRESQLVYAATDAFCLITIYQKLQILCKEKGVNLERIQEKYFKSLAENGGNAPSQKKIKGAVQTILHLKKQLPDFKEDNNKPRIKLAVDTMLLGMGRYLRSLGYDTWLLESIYQILPRNLQGRFVLTRGAAGYQRMVEAVEGQQERVFAVKSELVVEQLEEICRHLGIGLDPSRLFTVCFRCNSNTFIKLPIPYVISLMEASGCHLTSKKLPLPEEERQKVVDSLKGKAMDDLILYLSPQEEAQKKWTILPETELQIENKGRLVRTPETGERVEITRLQLVYPILDQVFVCSGCGKCFWSSLQLENEYKKEKEGEKMKNGEERKERVT